MSLAHLTRPLDEQLEREALELTNNPIYLRDYAIHRLQPKVTPTSPTWMATVFFNPDVFPNEVSLARIERHYAAEHPGREFGLTALTAVDLEASDIVKFPKAEMIFRQRGFVSDIEVRNFGRGDYNPKTTFRLRNRAAVHFQLSVVANLLNHDADAVGGAANIQKQLGALMGEIGAAPKPLASYRGMLLPRAQFWRRETIHLAYSWAAPLALEDAHADPYGLCSALPSEIAEQVVFEAQHSRELFSNASRSALLLWQTQGLAALRKAAWIVGFDGGTDLHKQINAEETLKSRTLKAVAANDPDAVRRDIPRAHAQAIADAYDIFKESMDEEVHRRGAHANFYGVSYGEAECSHSLSTNENVLAALHGSTYLPEFDCTDQYDCADPLLRLQPLAKWIGDLKRKRHAILDERTASLLLAFGDTDDDELGHPPLSDFAPLIEARLGGPAWALIVEDGLAIERTGASREIPVVYDWTRDAQEPWFAERRDGVIFIRGPLLDFPVHEAAEWNEKARIIDEEGGVVLHRRRDDEGNVLP